MQLLRELVYVERAVAGEVAMADEEHVLDPRGDVDVTTSGDRIYLVVYAGPKAQETAAKATHLRDSFKILSK